MDKTDGESVQESNSDVHVSKSIELLDNGSDCKQLIYIGRGGKYFKEEDRISNWKCKK